MPNKTTEPPTIEELKMMLKLLLEEININKGKHKDQGVQDALDFILSENKTENELEEVIDLIIKRELGVEEEEEDLENKKKELLKKAREQEVNQIVADLNKSFSEIDNPENGQEVPVGQSKSNGGRGFTV